MHQRVLEHYILHLIQRLLIYYPLFHTENLVPNPLTKSNKQNKTKIVQQHCSSRVNTDNKQLITIIVFLLIFRFIWSTFTAVVFGSMST